MHIETNVWFWNLSFLSENISPELAETYIITTKQHRCFNFQSTNAEKLVA
jgi:hypothetical protein